MAVWRLLVVTERGRGRGTEAPVAEMGASTAFRRLKKGLPFEGAREQKNMSLDSNSYLKVGSSNKYPLDQQHPGRFITLVNAKVIAMR